MSVKIGYNFTAKKTESVTAKIYDTYQQPVTNIIQVLAKREQELEFSLLLTAVCESLSSEFIKRLQRYSSL